MQDALWSPGRILSGWPCIGDWPAGAGEGAERSTGGALVRAGLGGPRSAASLVFRLIRLSLPSRPRWAPLTPRRCAILSVLVPAFVLFQLVHWIGFLLDELFFRGYRSVVVKAPVFIVGLPRSGTTNLQRILALDEHVTTMRSWELLLAPSITERKLWLAVAAVDRLLGEPGGRILRWIERIGSARLEAVHPTTLRDPEEDFLLLLPAFACFLLVLAFPEHPDLWRLSRLDDLDPAERRRLVGFYRSCVQRHLYVVGTERVYVSKNPSFTPFVRTLADAFPDARFLCCVRDPVETVPSQLSSIRGGLAFFGVGRIGGPLAERFVSLMAHYASHALAVSDTLPPDRWAFVPLARMRRDAAGTLTAALVRLEWEIDAAFRLKLEEASARSRSYRSRHRYSLGEFGLKEAGLVRRFAFLEDRFGFRRAKGPDESGAGR
ncbi:MAG: sulfotransferase [Gammaproteobacteria bacterium]|nr:sulfotransferase [Gammaproteobacteria bacterium]MDE0249351.1 sulfotransferase [Gammaproteobacteria bacterium]